MDTFKCKTTLRGGYPIRSISVLNEKMIVSCGRDGSLNVWDIDDGELCWSITNAHRLGSLNVIALYD
jgi:WD40 repeat protein